MKKLLSMLITASMIFSTVAISASAEAVTPPEGKSAKVIAADAVTTVNLRYDTANFDGGNDRTGTYHLDFEGVSYDFHRFNEIPINIYVDAPKDGVYGLAVIGRTHCYGTLDKNANTFTATDATGTVNSTLKGAVSLTKPAWADEKTPANNELSKIGLITLKAGLNVITLSSTNNNHFVGGIRIAGCDMNGVFPLALAADSVVEYLATTQNDVPFYNGGTALETGWKANYNGTSVYRWRLTNGIDFYVDAPVAGSYNLKTIGGSNPYNNAWITVSVNGTTAKNGPMVPTGTWDATLKDWGAITLAQGVNKITFAKSNDVAFNGLMLAGPGVITLPDGVTAYDISTTGDKVKYTFEAENVESTKSYTYIMDTAPFEIYVNAAEAGNYYFTSYSQAEYDRQPEHIATVTVNNLTSKTIPYTQGYNTGFAYTGGVPKHFKAVTFKAELKQGLNKISVYANNGQIVFDKFELRNYEIAGVTDKLTNSSVALYGTGLETTTTVVSSPKVVTRSVVYDAIPAGATTLDVSTLFAVKGKDDAKTIVAASYDVNGKLLDTKITTSNSLWNNIVGAKAAGLNVSGAATVKVMLLDDLTNLTNLLSLIHI